jgi:hypothetical protein
MTVNLFGVPSGEAERNGHTYTWTDVVNIVGQTHRKYDYTKTVLADPEASTPVIRNTASGHDTEPIASVVRSHLSDFIKTALFVGPCERFVTRNIWR